MFWASSWCFVLCVSQRCRWHSVSLNLPFLHWCSRRQDFLWERRWRSKTPQNRFALWSMSMDVNYFPPSVVLKWKSDVCLPKTYDTHRSETGHRRETFGAFICLDLTKRYACFIIMSRDLWTRNCIFRDQMRECGIQMFFKSISKYISQ